MLPKADSKWAAPTSISIIREGNVNLDEFVNHPAFQNLPSQGLEKVQDHYYSYYPIGSSLLGIPQIFLLMQINGPNEVVQHSLEAGKLVASSWMAISAVLIYLCFRRKFGEMNAVMASLLFAFATPALSTGSRAMWQQSGSLFINCILIYLCMLETVKNRSLIFLGFILGLDIWVRPSTIIFTFPVFVYFLFLVKRRIFFVIAGGIVPAVLYLIYNLNIYGSLESTYASQHINRIFQFSGFGKKLVGILLSPSRGVFIWSPFLLFSFWGIVKMKQDPDRKLSILFLTCIVLHTLLIASFDDWWGGHSIGPRLMSEIIPFLLWFAMKGIADLPEEGRKSAWFRNLWVAACIFSLIVHVRASVDFGPEVWNKAPDEGPRSWELRNPQFIDGDWTIKLLY
ncbi:dolichyl-phosphate-mannose--protein mannosyltransferase [Leptospira semungkisensis]|uniref:Dolichyl-phosphate-mannose--protein mannosyltransferase n=1 Tax=Leptospira semungkisensis TaxID=2484985 RepID=A0A4R9G226_9LEPT|nr:dolichyl-phosphate-mannose--protein mannosyltransferase [Leptospira semungkisensis]